MARDTDNSDMFDESFDEYNVEDNEDDKDPWDLERDLREE